MTEAVCEPVQVMSSCLDSLRATLTGLDERGIVQALREIEVISRQTQSVMLDVVAEAETRGIAAGEGFASTQRLLAAMLRLSAAEARTRVEHAAVVGTRRTITGQPLPPRLPATAAALAAGEIGVGQLRVIAETMAALPASVPEPVREQAEADLAAHARDFDPRRLRTIAHRLLAAVAFRAALARPNSVRPITCGTGPTTVKRASGTAACSVPCTISKCTCRAGTSPSKADASNSDLPRSSTQTANP